MMQILMLYMLMKLGSGNVLQNPSYFEGDIILSPEERRNIYRDNQYGATKSKWPSTVIPYDLHPNIGNVQGFLHNLTAAINDYHKYTCLRFKRRTNEASYILFVQEQGCGAPLGYHSGQNRISLKGSGCHVKGTIIHEIMHTLGFYHEQSRPDRDNYIKILWENINPSNMKDNFLKRSGIDSLGLPYDYLSIMHYPKNGFAKRGTNTIETLDSSYTDKIGQREGFSKLDIQQINKLYQCGKTTSSPITVIKPLGCADEYDYCSSYKRHCNSKAWQSFLRKDCKATCGFCGSKPTSSIMDTLISSDSAFSGCKDKLGKACHDFQKRGYCSSPSLKKYMQLNCRSSCGYCTPSCGIPLVGRSKVISGTNAKPGSWPWMTSLYHNGAFKCGGSLLSPNVILTAAHCVYKDPNPENYYVYLGDHDRRSKDGNEQLISLQKIHLHPEYNKPVRLNNDMAILLLKQPAIMNNRARPICLPDKSASLPTDSKCYITGWGKVRHPGVSHEILQQAQLKIVNNKRCHDLNSKMRHNMTVTDNMLCAGHDKEDPRTGCHGDSGGPFVCQHSNNRWTLEGVVSWGSSKCDSQEAYTVFARVRSFMKWIKKHASV